MAGTRKAPARKAAAKTPTSGVSKKKKAAVKPKHAPAGSGKLGGRERGKRKGALKASPITLTAATNTSAPDFIVRGTNGNALFNLTCYRGEGMCLLAINWKQGTPPNNFVGFAIEFMEPGSTQFYTLLNRIGFPNTTGQLNPNTLSSRLSPFQKFRWVHFPRNASTPGIYTYRVTSVFMDDKGVLSYGDFQEAAIELEAETYPGELNICFTRGFISSQAFVDHFGTNGGVGTLLPTNANTSITFKSTDPKEERALAWMGFEARAAILNTLDAAIADSTAQVRVAAYDFNDPEIVSRLQQLQGRLKIIIDDSGSHNPVTASETKAAAMLTSSAGAANVQRQHMGDLQHNKTIVVNGDKTKIAIGGSTNLSWRGIYVQNNSAVVLQGENAVQIFSDAFDSLWANPNNPAGFDSTASADWISLGFTDVDVQVTFSPHSKSNAKLQGIANDIASTESSLFYSLAFLYETKGAILNAITKVTDEDNVFVYGLSDKAVGGLNIQLPNGNQPVAFPAALLQDVPPPFKQEATGGSGTRLHHKFVVIDFNKPTARVYTGSYNFSIAADTKNAENLFVIKDQRVATSYMVEAVAMFDHYAFRDSENNASDAKPLELQEPPTDASIKPWWDKYWSDPDKERDRELFGQ
jgi:phosphatidylserine/phosphatidylglycerophosphate/cardiolipin synthase-like enzyme